MSGPKRYNFNSEENIWTNSRDGHRLNVILQNEIQESMGITLPDIDGDVDDEY